MSHTLTDSQGHPFEVVVVMRDGVQCRTCERIIRVREKAGEYREVVVRDDGVEVRAGARYHRCRDCLYREPLNTFNKSWRKDAPREEVQG